MRSLQDLAAALGDAEAGLTSTSDPHMQTHVRSEEAEAAAPPSPLQGPSSEGSTGWLGGFKLPLFQSGKEDGGQEGFLEQVGSWLAPPKMPSSGPTPPRPSGAHGGSTHSAPALPSAREEQQRGVD